MPRKIQIVAGSVTAQAELNDSQTAKLIIEKLPIVARANTWGDEIYFGIPVDAELEDDAKEVVQLGDLGYWGSGKAFCIFFGPTPVSRGDEIRPASAVNIVGKVTMDPKEFKKVKNGQEVRIELAS